MSSKLYNRYAAQLSAQFGHYKEAEQKLLKYLETNPSLINKHLTYNDLLLYTYRQFQEDEESVDRCLTYALEHIDLLPLLIQNFKKHGYEFENEYIISIDIAILLLKHRNRTEDIMTLCNKLASTYRTDKQKRHQFAQLAYDVVHNDMEEVDIHKGMLVNFENLRNYMQKQKE